jgi:hypothetical protein
MSFSKNPNNGKKRESHSTISDEEKKDSTPSDARTKRIRKDRRRGYSLTLNVQSDNEDNAVALLVDNFPITAPQARIVVEVSRMLEPEDPAIFISFQAADRIHNALSVAGPGRPCQPGANPAASFNALKAWVEGKLPQARSTKAQLISGGQTAVAFGNLSQDESSEICNDITHLPDDFTWVAEIRRLRLSCGGALVMTGSGVGTATVAKLPSTVFFDD